MNTVRDFKNFVLQTTGVQSHCEFPTMGLKAFWVELNNLGWEKKTTQPEECDDIDATAFLTDKEWAELDTKFRQLQ